MTLTAMLADLYRRFGYQSSPATEVTTRLTAFLNETQREITMEPGFKSLLRTTITFDSVASTPEYLLPGNIAEILSIRDTANRRTLDRISEAEYRRRIADPSANTGLAWAYAPIGLTTAPPSRPSDPSQIFAVSSSAGDTQLLHYEVVQADGNVTTGSVTMNGVTAVSLSSSLTTIVEIADIYLATAAVGVVTILEDSGVGTALGSIKIGQTRQYRWRVALVPTPSSAFTYTVDAERNVTDLAVAADQPQMPERFHYVLVSGARMKEYEFKNDTERYIMARGEYQSHLGQMRAFLASGPNEVIVPGGKPTGISQLGGYYPADTWVR